MNAPHTIMLEDTMHEDELSRVPHPDEEGWVWTPRNQKELRRIHTVPRKFTQQGYGHDGPG